MFFTLFAYGTAKAFHIKIETMRGMKKAFEKCTPLLRRRVVLVSLLLWGVFILLTPGEASVPAPEVLEMTETVEIVSPLTPFMEEFNVFIRDGDYVGAAEYARSRHKEFETYHAPVVDFLEDQARALDEQARAYRALVDMAEKASNEGDRAAASKAATDAAEALRQWNVQLEHLGSEQRGKGYPALEGAPIPAGETNRLEALSSRLAQAASGDAAPAGDTKIPEDESSLHPEELAASAPQESAPTLYVFPGDSGSGKPRILLEEEYRASADRKAPVAFIVDLSADKSEGLSRDKIPDTWYGWFFSRYGGVLFKALASCALFAGGVFLVRRRR